ncbi:MAG: agmatinase [Bacteroidetes bacterium]|nr:agmatinase [Bacteroidota bacterium]
MINEKQANWFLSSEIENGNPESSRFHVIPVPFEDTVSYGSGTENSPTAVISASSQLELWDGTSNPAYAGIHTKSPVKQRQGESPAALFSRLASETADTLQKNAVPVLIGGEHSITFAPVSACRDHYGEIGVIQFDAHADLRKEYEGSKYSHACVMRRIVDELQLPIFQIGLRSISQEESEFISANNIPGIGAKQAVVESVMTINLPADFPHKVFVTIDVDGLDPSIMPATGTPVPGGLGWYQILGMLQSIADQRSIVGFDVVELAPIENLHFCEFSAAQLIYQVMGMIFRNKLS